jgi:hypothetical protein
MGNEMSALLMTTGSQKKKPKVPPEMTFCISLGGVVSVSVTAQRTFTVVFQRTLTVVFGCKRRN